MGDLMFNFGDFIRAIFVRVFCVRGVARFAPLLLFTPGAVWGALGGPRPLLGGQGAMPPVLFVLGPSRGFLPPFQGGLGGL